MKIALVISCINSKSSGSGGHYYSLIETFNQLSKVHDVEVFNLGNERSKALENSNLDVINIIHQSNAVYKIYKEFKLRTQDSEFDVIHAFDSLSFFWARTFGSKFNIPFSVTMCGGRNPKYFPFSKRIVLFSKENLLFFESKHKFNDALLYLIPNRLSLFSNDEHRIAKIEKQLPEKEIFRFLRISRIGDYYKKSSLQIIELVNRLNAEGIKCFLIFIGTIEDQKCFEELKALGGKHIYFFTEDFYTKNAKELISISDAVMGTGRSFMEAASKGKLLLVPSIDALIPNLITKENFQTAFQYNFSERIINTSISEKENYKSIKALITKTENQDVYKEFSTKIFEEYFSSEKITEKYEKVFFNREKTKAHYVDWILNLFFVYRSFYK